MKVMPCKPGVAGRLDRAGSGRRVVQPERVPSQRRGVSSHLLHLRPRRRGARQRLDFLDLSALAARRSG